MKYILLVITLLLSLLVAVPLVYSAGPTFGALLFTDAGDVDEAVINKVTGISNNDLLLILLATDNTDTLTRWDTPPTGWNLIASGGNNDTDNEGVAFWRIADGSEAATETIVSEDPGDTDDVIGWYVRVSGVDTTTPIDVTGTVLLAASSNSAAIPGVTTTVVDTLAFYFLSFDGGDGDPFGEPTGWTEQDDKGVLDIGGVSGAWGTKAVPTATDTGTATVSLSETDGNVSFQWAVRPSAVAAVAPTRTLLGVGT